MAKISESFRSNFFNAASFLKGPQTFTVAAVEEMELGQGSDAKERLVVHFEDEERSFALNKTNAVELAAALGDDTDDWAGQEVTLSRGWTQYQGKRVACVIATAGTEPPDATADDQDDTADEPAPPQRRAAPVKAPKASGKPQGKGKGKGKG